ncbi:MAG TPA: hypothetical protein VLZ29_05060 [Sulfurimonas sp.]|uniref:hypothetical protein n=1 Tax=Sulfurimonas sp. TaxID=2022749 RepID=UPI002D1BDD8C|nr:hypothetical protein [Sulfurimonas sp.]HUH42463.1 hypothetical protein [Sulfurimonas sp.]
MKKEYKIIFDIPKAYKSREVLNKLPSPISKQMTEIYNYAVKDYGFYLLDNLVDQQTVGEAMKIFIDEALKYSKSIEVVELS